MAELAVSVDRPFGHVGVRLTEVGPGGESRLITRGLLNLAFRSGFSDPQAVVPGEVMKVRVPMRATSVVVAAGHRLRLAVAGTDFALAWPPPGRLTLTLHPHDSRLVLPLADGTSRQRRVKAAPIRLAPVEVEGSEHLMEVVRLGTTTSLQRTVGSIEHQPGGFDYRSRQVIEVGVEDDDPETVRAASTARVRLERGSWQVSTLGSIAITSQAEHFNVTIDLEAREGEKVVFTRRWEEQISRTWV